VLRLIEEEPGQWERFQREPEAMVPLAPAAAKLLPRWRRARELGAIAEGPAHPLGVALADLTVRRDGALGSLREGTRAIEALEAEVTPQGLLTLVTDAAGVIVRARGGAAFSSDVRRTRLVEGARWDERARGTNAIGTAIVEAQASSATRRRSSIRSGRWWRWST